MNTSWTTFRCPVLTGEFPYCDQLNYTVRIIIIQYGWNVALYMLYVLVFKCKDSLNMHVCVFVYV